MRKDPASLVDQPGQRGPVTFSVEFFENAPRLVTVTRADGTTVTRHVAAERPDVLRELLADPDVVDMTVVPASLEDVVLALYTGQAAS